MLNEGNCFGILIPLKKAYKYSIFNVNILNFFDTITGKITVRQEQRRIEYKCTIPNNELTSNIQSINICYRASLNNGACY